MKLCTTNTSPDFTPICPCLHKDKRHMELHTSNILKVNQIVNKNLQIFFSHWWPLMVKPQYSLHGLGGIKKQDHISTSYMLHRPLIRCPIKGWQILWWKSNHINWSPPSLPDWRCQGKQIDGRISGGSPLRRWYIYPRLWDELLRRWWDRTC